MYALTHAVTQPQPLAWVIAAGHCPVIMSDTRPDMEHEGKLIGIHAAVGSRREHANTTMERWVSVMGPLDVAVPTDLPRGALVGVARLVGVLGCIRGQHYIARGRWAAAGKHITEAMRSQVARWWRPGRRWGLVVEDAVLLPEPIPMRGAAGVWRMPEDRERVAHNGIMRASTAGLLALEQWRKRRAER